MPDHSGAHITLNVLIIHRFRQRKKTNFTVCWRKWSWGWYPLESWGHKNASPSLASYCFVIILSKYEPHPLLTPPQPLPVVLCFTEKHSWLLFSYPRTRLITQSHSALPGLNSYNSFSILLGSYPNTQIIPTILQVHILVCQDQNAFSSKSMRIESKPRLAGASVIKMLCRKKPISFLWVWDLEGMSQDEPAVHMEFQQSITTKFIRE